jgi:hypothetical protein
MLVELRARLPRDLVEWLQQLAEARGETVDEVLTWTLGTLRNLHDRWRYAWGRAGPRGRRVGDARGDEEETRGVGPR